MLSPVAGGLRGGVLASCGGEDQRLQKGVRRQTVRPVHAGPGGLTSCVETGNAGASVQVGGDSAHAVVRGRGDRNELVAPVDALRGEHRGDARELLGQLRDVAGIQPHVLGVLVQGAAHPSGDDVAGRELCARVNVLQEALARIVEQHSPGPAHRLGDEKVGARQDGGVELDELHIRQHRPGAGRREDPGTRAHPTAGGAREDAAVSAGRDDGRIRTEVYRVARAAQPGAGNHAIREKQFGQFAAGVLGDPTTLRATTVLARLLLNLLCDLFREEGVQGRPGAVTPRVDDPLRAVRRLQRERRRAIREQVGGETGREQAAHRHRAFCGQELDRPGLLGARRDQPRPRGQGVRHVRGHAIGRVDRGGDPTLRELRGTPAGGDAVTRIDQGDLGTSGRRGERGDHAGHPGA